MKSLVGAATFAAAVVLGANAASASVIYSQVITPDSLTSSDSGTSTFSYNTFSLATSAAINKVEWQGLYYPSGPGIQDFDIVFYVNTGGVVGTQLADFHVGSAVNQTPTGQLFAGFWPYYGYTADLGTGLSLAPGSYWVSIFDNSLNGGDAFFWAIDNTLPPTAISSFDPNMFVPTSPGYFILSGNAIVTAAPEPLTLVLFGTGIAGAAAMRRRRKQIVA